MSKLNLYDLCGVLVSKNGLEDKEARRFVQAMFDIIQEGLDEDKIVKVKGLGTFKIIDVDARESINVNTGGRVLIKGHSKLTFTPDSVMKEIVNKPFSQFETVVLNDGVDFPETQEDDASGEAEEPSAASVVDKKPEPVVEKTAGHVVENKPEPVVEPTPTGEIKSESIFGAAPAADTASSEETTSLDESAPVDEYAPVEDSNPVEEPNSDVDENVSETEEEEEKSSYRCLMYCAAVLLLVVAAAYGGYLYGKYEISEEIAHKQMLADLKAAEETTQKATAESMKDTTTQEVDATKIGAISTEKIKQETKTEENEADKSTADKTTAGKSTADKSTADETKNQQPETTDDSKKYEDKDARVRTGAYRIVGLDKTVKAKAGQTVEDISNRNLGHGMSCYVEVYNGLKGKTVLKEGQVINIPKLQLKKRR